MALPKWVWKETAEVLGVVGIIAGIIFLGFELRQNNELMEAEARFNRLSAVTDTWRFIADQGDLAEIWGRFDNNEAISIVEQRRIQAQIMSVFVLLEWTFREMDEDSTDLNQVRIVQLRTFAGSALWNQTWEERKTSFDPEFVQWMQSNVVDVVNR